MVEELLSDTQRLITDDNKSTSTKSDRRKLVYSVCCCGIFFLLGWMFQLVGPALVELQYLSGVTFTLASTYITAYNIAHIAGSIEMGLLYGKVNPYLLVTINICITIVCTVLTPFCSSYLTMLLIHFCIGTSTGALDTVALAEISALWGAEKDTPMHALYFALAFGSVLSPVTMNPFFTNFDNVESNVEYRNLTRNISTLSINDENKTPNMSNLSQTIEDISVVLESSKLYIAYLITAGLAVILLLPFLVMLFHYVFSKFEISYCHEEVMDKKYVTGKKKYVILVVVGLASALLTSIEESISDFLPSFCVKQMHWTSQNGAFVVSVFRIAFAVGRLLGILFASLYYSPIKVALIHCFVLIASFVGITVSGIYSVDYGVWISSAVAGFGLSVLAPCWMNVTEENFFPISGKIATYFITTASFGYAVVALLIGYLMEHISDMYFGYILLSACIAFTVLLFVCNALLNCIKYEEEKEKFAYKSIQDITKYASTTKMEDIELYALVQARSP